MASSSVKDTMSAPSSRSLASAGDHAYLHAPEGPNSSPRWIPHFTLPSSAMDSAYNHSPRLESPLTSSPHSRITGLPTVSSSTQSTTHLSNVAIAPPTHITIYSNSCHDAGPVLNLSVPSSSVSNAQSSTEPSVLPPNSSYHDLNNSSTRPRTSNQVFSSTSDLAAHYGIPTTFPPPPSIPSHRPEPVTQPSTAVPDFFALKDNYLNMLSQKSECTSAPSSTDMSSATVSPADLQQPVAAEFTDFEGLLRTLAEGANGQEMSSFEPSDFLTSPWTPSLDTFESPGETPQSDFLSTPLIPDNDVSMLTGPHDMPLFDDSNYFDPAEVFESSKPMPADTSNLYTMSPTSPNLGTPALNPATLFSPALPMDSAHCSAPHHSVPEDSSSPPNARRRISATGTRKNITAESLVPIDAPTQPRRYLTPSATSKKELPAVFARKRARQQMLEGEEDELDEPLKPNATELEQIEWKRRQNTLAARKSRKRKLMHQQDLETQVTSLTNEREKWRQRALTLQGILQANGIPFAEFQD